MSSTPSRGDNLGKISWTQSIDAVLRVRPNPEENGVKRYTKKETKDTWCSYCTPRQDSSYIIKNYLVSDTLMLFWIAVPQEGSDEENK